MTKEAIGWPPDSSFLVPDEVLAFFSRAMDRGRQSHREWIERRDQVFEADPAVASAWNDYFEPAPVELDPPDWEVGSSLATRAAGGQVFDQIAEKVPGFIGGAADLVESTKTHISFSGSFSRDDRTGRNIHFGIREHAMGTLVNGMTVHGGLRPYGATFFIFNDYMRPAVRLSALMNAPSIWVYTHDSVFLGEDGPTHQPIEQLASMRAMPNMWVVRPADAYETVEAWELALNRTGPTAILLTRQGVPVLDHTSSRGGVAQGGYVLRGGEEAVLIATGSEVHLALQAADLIDDRSIRVVSMPCWEAFAAQTAEYRADVLGDLPAVSLEAGATLGWERWTGADGLNIGVDRFGASAPYRVIAERLGFTPDAVADRVRHWLESR